MQHGLFGSIQWSGSGTFKVTFNVHGHSRLRSMFTDIHGYVQGSRTFKVTFKVRGNSRLRSRFWYVGGYVHEVVLERHGRERIDSGSDIGTRHGA